MALMQVMHTFTARAHAGKRIGKRLGGSRISSSGGFPASSHFLTTQSPEVHAVYQDY